MHSYGIYTTYVACTRCIYGNKGAVIIYGWGVVFFENRRVLKFCPPLISVHWNFVPPKNENMHEIDTRYLVICLAVITLNKHTTCCLDGVCICHRSAYCILIKPLYHIKCIRTVIKGILLVTANAGAAVNRADFHVLKFCPPLTSMHSNFVPPWSLCNQIFTPLKTPPPHP